jgi:hypothetical protein
MLPFADSNFIPSCLFTASRIRASVPATLQDVAITFDVANSGPYDVDEIPQPDRELDDYLGPVSPRFSIVSTSSAVRRKP